MFILGDVYVARKIYFQVPMCFNEFPVEISSLDSSVASKDQHVFFI